MPLSVGVRLGPYEILAPIGAGGMGEVYRARDTKLGRDVAVKVLPEAFVHDADRMARFTREAQMLASLNHPNIAHIYGVDESGDVHALVMELVAGESPKGPLPFDEAWNIACQIAAALEYAHDKGIVHRDLKPANIKVTPDGVVKLLDFGLAKALSDTPEWPPSDPVNSPTLTIGGTVAGTILGTAAYMAPEQAKGKRVDKRADIWAWGVVLYELLTGERLFQGDDAADTLAQVLTKEPDLKKAPRQVRKLLRRCLEKDPKLRLRDIGVVHELLENAEAPPQATATLWPWIIAGVFAVVAAVTGMLLWRASRPVYRPLMRLNLDLGPDAFPGFDLTVAISPDGRRLVYPSRGPHGAQQLAARLFDQPQPTLLQGTENGQAPFFSPDGQWIGFFSAGRIQKASVQGGPPTTLGNTQTMIMGGSASWGEDGNIIAASGTLPMSSIPAAGGTLHPLIRLGSGEIYHRWPQVLPGAALFTALASIFAVDSSNLEAVSLKTGQVKILQGGVYHGRYLPSGHLVYVRQGTLFGVKFDPVRLEMRGSPVPLLDDLARPPLTGSLFDFSTTGTFVYAAGKSEAQTWQISWLDGSGKVRPLIDTPAIYGQLRLSPDGRKLAFIKNGATVYVYDLVRDIQTQLTSEGQSNIPVWAPDSKHVIFTSGGSLLWMRADGGGEPLPLLRDQNSPRPWSITRDGRWLAYVDTDRETGFNIWTLPLDLADPDHPKVGQPELFLRSVGFNPTFSPDGHWIAYRSNESGRLEIYVRPFPGGSGGKWRISEGGALYVFWSSDGREMFYETQDDRIAVLDYKVDGASFVPGKPRLWSDKQLLFPGAKNLDLAPDGKRFVVFTRPESAPGAQSSVHVTMLLNFFDELKRRIP